MLLLCSVRMPLPLLLPALSPIRNTNLSTTPIHCRNGWPADSWGKGEQFSEQIPLPLDSALGLEAGDSIVSISAGWNHVFAIVEMARTGMRKVMSWGFNDEGQLGLGHCDDVGVPTFVESLAGIAKDIVQVSCGQEHTVVLLSNGSMLACGSLEHGSTGTGEPMCVINPSLA